MNSGTFLLMCVNIFTFMFFGFALGPLGLSRYTDRFRAQVTELNFTSYVIDVAHLAVIHHPSKLYDFYKDWLRDKSEGGDWIGTEVRDVESFKFTDIIPHLSLRPSFTRRHLNTAGFFNTFNHTMLDEMEQVARLAVGFNVTLPPPKWYGVHRECVDYHGARENHCDKPVVIELE